MTTYMPSRRTLAKGAAWSVPAVIAAGTVPAYASITSPSLCPSTTTCVSSGAGTACWNSCGPNYTLYVNSYDKAKVQVQTSQLFSIPSGVTVPNGTTYTFTYAVYGPSAPTSPTFNGQWGGSNWGTWSVSSTSAGSVTVGTYNSGTSVGCYLNSDGSVPTATNYPMCCPDPCLSPCTKYETPCSPVCTGTTTLTKTVITISVKLSSAITGPSSLCGGVSFDLPLTAGQIGGYEITSVTASGGPRICNLPKIGQLFTNEKKSDGSFTTANTTTYHATGTCGSGEATWK